MVDGQLGLNRGLNHSYDALQQPFDCNVIIGRVCKNHWSESFLYPSHGNTAARPEMQCICLSLDLLVFFSSSYFPTSLCLHQPPLPPSSHSLPLPSLHQLLLLQSQSGESLHPPHTHTATDKRPDSPAEHCPLSPSVPTRTVVMVVVVWRRGLQGLDWDWNLGLTQWTSVGREGRGGGGGEWVLKWLGLSEGRYWGLYRKTFSLWKKSLRVEKNLPRVCHIYLYSTYAWMCMLMFLCVSEMRGMACVLMENRRGSVTHEWPVLAPVRMSAFVLLDFLIFIPRGCRAALGSHASLWAHYQEPKHCGMLFRNRPRC